jgi:hypothetical protein
MYDHSAKLSIYYQNNREVCMNNMQRDQHYFQVLINDICVYIYIPLKKVERNVHLEMLYRASGDM